MQGQKPDLVARQAQLRTQEAPLSSGAAHGQTRPVSDPRSQIAAHLHSFNRVPRIAFGIITDYSMLAHCYRVQLEHSLAPIACTLGSHASLSSIGPRELNSLNPGDQVWVLVNPSQTAGVILCLMPTAMSQAMAGFPDFLTQASRTRVDEGHRLPMKMLSNGRVTDWLSGRPLDGINELGWITATGLKISIDDYMVQLAVDEMTGVFGFYHDSLLRIAGYNLQLWTAGNEREGFNDQGEYNDSLLYTPYPWEQTGVFAQTNPSTQNSAQATQVDQPWYSKLEPLSDHAQPFHRSQLYQGYLGQGGRTVVVAPPLSPPAIWQYKPGSAAGGETAPASTPPPLVGVFEESRGLDGRYFVRSAKGIVLAKRLLIPVPARQKRPEDTQGDNETNYKFAGLNGNGPAHQITGDIGTTDTDNPQLQRCAAVLDLHTYLFNYAGLHPFHYHDYDYATPEESALEYAQVDQVVPQFTSLATRMFLAAPPPRTLQIDHRYGEQNYYPSESFLALLEDGGIVLGDGFGAELRMTGGHIFMTAPGDIWLQSGRSLQQWAGFDVVTRANNCVDVSTTTGFIRLKAQQSLEALAVEGGVLIESRGAGGEYDFTNVGDDVNFAGVVLRAPQSTVVSLASDIYLRTGTQDGTIPSGDIVIDAGRGTASVITHANNQHHFVGGSVLQYFGQDEDWQVGYEFSADFCTIGAPLGVLGPAIINGDIINHGFITVVGGHIATEQAQAFALLVPPLQGQGLTDAYQAIADIQSRAQQTLPTLGQQVFNINPEGEYYSNNQIGNDITIEQAGFSFRTVEQYKSEAFVLYESRWQQMARLGQQQTPSWTEVGVTGEVEETWPYPGRENFTGNTFMQQDLNLYLFEEGGFVAKDRATSHQPINTDPQYANPQYAAPQATTLNGNYPIVMDQE